MVSTALGEDEGLDQCLGSVSEGTRPERRPHVPKASWPQLTLPRPFRDPSDTLSRHFRQRTAQRPRGHKGVAPQLTLRPSRDTSETRRRRCRPQKALVLPSASRWRGRGSPRAHTARAAHTHSPPPRYLSPPPHLLAHTAAGLRLRRPSAFACLPHGESEAPSSIRVPSAAAARALRPSGMRAAAPACTPVVVQAWLRSFSSISPWAFTYSLAFVIKVLALARVAPFRRSACRNRFSAGEYSCVHVCPSYGSYFSISERAAQGPSKQFTYCMHTVIKC